jgi:hypothetical protein
MRMVSIKNPILIANFGPWFTDIRLYATGNNGKTLPDCRSFSSLPWANNSSDTLDILKKGASWRTLQIQDPPATTLIVEKRVADRGADNVSRRILSFPNGVRMGLLYDLAWEHCARFDCYFGVRWDGIPLSDDEAAKSPRQLGYHVAKWRSETFLPTLGGEEVVLLELYFGEQWFLLNYKTGQGVPDNRVQEWEKFRSEGMGEGETGCLVNTESIPDQVYKME